MTTDQQPQHVHAEAFMMMEYRSDDGLESLFIWNSRDGVTPFIITIPGTDKQATHVNWRGDRYQPDHKPSAGDWIFVDLTEQRARELAMRNAVRFWEMPEDTEYHPSKMYADVDSLATMLLEEFERDAERGAPDLIEVQEDWA